MGEGVELQHMNYGGHNSIIHKYPDISTEPSVPLAYWEWSWAATSGLGISRVGILAAAQCDETVMGPL